jgi:hypothetical protein
MVMHSLQPMANIVLQGMKVSDILEQNETPIFLPYDISVSCHGIHRMAALTMMIIIIWCHI